jgi:PKD repeat protein
MAAGSFTVTLTVAGPGGSDAETKVDYVTAYEPVNAAFSATPTSGVRPLEVTFSNGSIGDYTLSLWEFGDGLTSTLDSPVHTYATTSTYTVTLTVRGPGGEDVEVKPGYVRVYEPVEPVVVSFTASPVAGVAPLTVVFTNTSTGGFVTSLWQLGDGVTSTLHSPSHTYLGAGVYGITLTVSGPGGSDVAVAPTSITVLEMQRVYVPLVIHEFMEMSSKALGLKRPSIKSRQELRR